MGTAPTGTALNTLKVNLSITANGDVNIWQAIQAISTKIGDSIAIKPSDLGMSTTIIPKNKIKGNRLLGSLLFFFVLLDPCVHFSVENIKHKVNRSLTLHNLLEQHRAEAAYEGDAVLHGHRNVVLTGLNIPEDEIRHLKTICTPLSSNTLHESSRSSIVSMHTVTIASASAIKFHIRDNDYILRNIFLLYIRTKCHVEKQVESSLDVSVLAEVGTVDAMLSESSSNFFSSPEIISSIDFFSASERFMFSRTTLSRSINFIA